MSLPVTTLLGDLDGFRYSLAVDGRAALQIFQGGAIVTDYPSLGTGPNWLAQPSCRKFGLNTPDAFAHARFGWTANQEMDCGSNDTAIGLGLVTQRTDARLAPHGAGYVCLAGGCMDGATTTDRTVDVGGNGFLWGR